MTINHRHIDHLVYCVPDLDTGIKQFEALLGVTAIIGGKHLNQGTQNALIHLGDQCYLELLAVDQDNTRIIPPRWMGVDVLTSSKLTRWALKADDIIVDQQILKAYNPALGQLIGGQRQLTSGKFLHWQMTKPLAIPEVELMPFITDWSASELHPCDQLPELCKLVNLKLYHPNPEPIKKSLITLLGEIEIERSKMIEIKAIIDSPKGRTEI